MKYLRMDCVAAELTDMVEPLKNIPAATRKNMYVTPWMLDFSETSKFAGVGRYPSILQFRHHFPSIVMSTYQSEKEALEVKFTQAAAGVSAVQPFSIGFVDGQNKALIVQSIFALLHEAEPQLHKEIFGNNKTHRINP